MGTICNCSLTDCHYYRPYSGSEPGDCDCQHPEKRYYMKNPCPLYKKQFSQQQAKDLLKRFKKNR